MKPIEMLTLISTVNQLAEQSKDGIKPFSKAETISFFDSAKLNEDDIPDPIYYDDRSPDENGRYPVIQQCLLVDHHDIISIFGKSNDIFGVCNLEIKAEISPDSEDDANTCIIIKSIDDDDWEICIHDGMWYDL